jgi:hypothetical protein
MSEIRFDPATGLLEGTDLLPVAELIRQAHAKGYTLVPTIVWDELAQRGDPIGVNAKLRNPRFGENWFPNTSEASAELGISKDIQIGIAVGFDTSANIGDQLACRAAFDYGRAVRLATREKSSR